MASIWALGRIWLRVPESIKIIVTGELPENVYSKDLALHVIGMLGADGGLYQSVEWTGGAIESFSLGDRAVLTNMMGEFGAKNSYIAPDQKVFDFLKGRAVREFDAVYPDADAEYARVVEINAADLQPVAACPHTVDNINKVSDLNEINIEQAFLGTCTNGRIEDLQRAADVLKGRKIHPQVRMIVIPASSQVYLQALDLGLLKIFVEAGAVVESPGCGPCMGNHLGIPAIGEVSISSANRNFKGRMGTKESEIYLANPAVVAASAVAGRIASPADLENRS